MRFGWFRRSKERSAAVDGLEAVRSLFAKFRRIQKLNTRALELMAEMEQALGGEYIFDRAFLASSVRDLSTLTHQVVYSLNAMSQNRYVDLFDCYQSIRGALDDILEGGAGPFASHLTLPYTILGWELEPLAGMLNVCLAEARQRLDLPAPDGFAVSVAGCRLFMQENAEAGLLEASEEGETPAAHALLPAALPAPTRSSSPRRFSGSPPLPPMNPKRPSGISFAGSIRLIWCARKSAPKARMRRCRPTGRPFRARQKDCIGGQRWSSRIA